MNRCAISFSSAVLGLYFVIGVRQAAIEKNNRNNPKKRMPNLFGFNFTLLKLIKYWMQSRVYSFQMEPVNINRVMFVNP